MARNARQPNGLGRIVGVSALGGLGIGLVMLTAEIIQALPEWQRGYVGMFGLGFGLGVRAILGLGGGIIFGLAVGLVVGGIWWAVRGRYLEETDLGARNPYPVPAVGRSRTPRPETRDTELPG